MASATGQGLAGDFAIAMTAWAIRTGLQRLDQRQQQPLVRHIDQLLTRPQRFGAVRDELARLPCAAVSGFAPTQAWQTLMRWLLHFLPGRYKRLAARHSEVLGRA